MIVVGVVEVNERGRRKAIGNAGEQRQEEREGRRMGGMGKSLD